MKSRSYYKDGDYNVICDRKGVKRKRSECAFEWTGALVDRDAWEARHPQDFVRGIRDDQRVPHPRPRGTGPSTASETTLDGNEVSGQTVLSVTATTSMSVGDPIVIYLDNDETHFSTIASISDGDTVTINESLPSTASSGNKVLTYSNLTTSADL